MAIPVLLILAVLWAAFFVWPLLQSRASGRRVDSVGDFTSRLRVIGRTNGHTFRRPVPPTVLEPGPGLELTPVQSLAAAVRGRAGTPRQATPAQRRRRDVLTVLGVLCVGSLALVLLVGGMILVAVHLLADALLATYLVLLARIRLAAQERRVKVRYLPEPTPAPALVLRRSASS